MPLRNEGKCPVLTGELCALAMNSEAVSLSNVRQCEAFSSLERLLRVTDLAMKFFKLLKAKCKGDKREEPELRVQT